MIQKSYRKIHFIGMGGIGMSGLAQICLKNGIKVSGSDIKESKIVERVRSLGGEFFLGHRVSNIASDVTDVVYSSSIANSNAELNFAFEKGLRVIHRSDLLLEISQDKTLIAICGAHGKTTTTSFISLLLKENGFEPTCYVGGEVLNFKTNAILGKGKYLVAELDESDGSFLKFRPDFAVLTNIDREHLDYFKNISLILKLNKKFIEGIRPGGRLFTCGDDPNIRKILSDYKKSLSTYGISNDCNFYASEIKLEGFKSEYQLFFRKKRQGAIRLNIPGVHNIINSLAAVSVGFELGVDFKKIKDSLYLYKGASRRFEVRLKKDGIMIVEDYAHHPTEISATINAARSMNFNRIIGVFQPHRFSRTKLLKQEFGKALSALDKLILTDIYSASEPPLKGISAQTIQEEVAKRGNKDIKILPKQLITEHILEIVKKGDLVLIMGAGDINSIALELADKLG